MPKRKINTIDEEGQVKETKVGSTLERPNPSQSSLDAILDNATRMRLIDRRISSGEENGQVALDNGITMKVFKTNDVLLDIAAPSSIASLCKTLEIIEDPDTFSTLVGHGDFEIELYQDQYRIATIEYLGAAIRWNAWEWDAELKDSLRLLNWFADEGCTAPLEASNEKDRYVLEIAYPDPEQRVLILFEWLGSGEGNWSGYPSRERFEVTVLDEFPTDLLLSALTKQTLTDQHLEGAARYLGGWNFPQKKNAVLLQLPVELKQRLLEHCLRSSDDEKVQCAKKAFSV